MPHDGSPDETHKEWMRRERTTRQFRMELCADEERMLRKLYDLHEVALGIHPRHTHARVRELLTIGVIELVPVTMTFPDDFFPVQFPRETRR